MTSCEVYEENELFDFIFTPKQKCLTCNHSREMCKIGEFKYKMPLFRYFRYLHSCSIFLTISKCRILSYSFYRNLMKKHDYKTRWLQQYLIYIFVSVVNCYSTWMDLRRRRRIERRRKSQKKKKKANNNVKNEIYFKSYFCAGGRHQTAVDGEIVCKFLQTCTDIMLLSNSQHFKGKSFHFKGYKLLSEASKNIMDSSEPLYFSRIPLELLKDFLNMKELRDLSNLHNICIPKNVEKKTTNRQRR